MYCLLHPPQYLLHWPLLLLLLSLPKLQQLLSPWWLIWQLAAAPE